LIGNEEIKSAVEEFVIAELKKICYKHMSEIVEDTLVDIMQQVVIRMYKSDRMKGIQFEIELKAKDS
jgi:hypothetical protein